MLEQNINILRQIRAELMERVNALDSAISLMERIDGTPADEPLDIAPTVTPNDTPLVKGKTRNTRFESAIDLTQQSEPEGPWECPACGAINPVGRKTCIECKAKRP